MPVAATTTSRREIEQALDLVEWDVSGRVELGGRLLAAPVTFRAGSNEGLTWQRLIADRIGGGPGFRSPRSGSGWPRPGPSAPRSPTWRRGTSMRCAPGWPTRGDRHRQPRLRAWILR